MGLTADRSRYGRHSRIFQTYSNSFPNFPANFRTCFFALTDDLPVTVRDGNGWKGPSFLEACLLPNRLLFVSSIFNFNSGKEKERSWFTSFFREREKEREKLSSLNLMLNRNPKIFFFLTEYLYLVFIFFKRDSLICIRICRLDRRFDVAAWYSRYFQGFKASVLIYPDPPNASAAQTIFVHTHNEKVTKWLVEQNEIPSVNKNFYVVNTPLDNFLTMPLRISQTSHRSSVFFSLSLSLSLFPSSHG